MAFYDISLIGGGMSSRPEVESTPESIIRDEEGIHIPQRENPEPEKYHYVPMAKATLSADGSSFVSHNKSICPPYKTHLKDLRIIGQIIWSDRILIK